MFPNNDDLPLFSQTPIRADQDLFRPKTTGSQASMAKCRVCMDTGWVIVNNRLKACICEAGAAHNVSLG
jgi:hypothetical protein